MEKYFNLNTGEKVNIVEHTLEQLQRWPDLKIYIGTDSQDDGRATVYATAIVYRYGSKGAHVIYFREKVQWVKDTFLRLYGEGTRTLDTAKILSDEVPSVLFKLEFDYADVKKTLSSALVSVLRGWAQGLNYNHSFKSGGQLSTKAADHIVRHPEIYK